MGSPALPALLAKCAFFLLAAVLSGWAILPGFSFRHVPVGRFVVWLGLGAAALILGGFTLTRYDLPARPVAWLPLVLVAGRLVASRRRPDAAAAGGFLAFTAAMMALYLLPFLVLRTSGFYAYGGGDQSSYFRVSEMLLDTTKAEVARLAERSPERLAPPSPNWAALSFVRQIEAGLETYANQTIALPFLAMGGQSTEESYSACIAMYGALVCWCVALLVSVLLDRPCSTAAVGLVATGVMAGFPVMSMLLKHAIPAATAWGMTACLLAVVAECALAGTRLPLFALAVISTTVTFLYLPALLVVGAAWLVLGALYMRAQGLGAPRDILLVVALIAILGNTELGRPVRLFLANTKVVLDYRVNWKQLPAPVLGLADFETMLTRGDVFRRWGRAGWLIAAAGVALGLRALSAAGRAVLLALLVPMGAAMASYMAKTGHYQVIRMSEFVGTLCLATALTGFGDAGRRGRALAAAAACTAMYFCLWPPKAYILDVTTRLHSELRASLKDADALRLPAALAEYARGRGRAPLYYWMNWGPIQFANDEIQFRTVPYVEAYDYDYAYLHLDILSEQLLRDAVLVHPRPGPAGILDVPRSVDAEPALTPPGYALRDLSARSGVAAIGTGWVPYPRPYQPGNYLRGELEGGLVFWSTKPQRLAVAFEAWCDGPRPGAYSVRLGDRPAALGWAERALRFAVENGKPAPEEARRRFAADELKFAVPPEGTPKARAACALVLDPGVHVLHLHALTPAGGRGGVDAETQAPNAAAGKVDWIAFSRIAVRPLPDAIAATRAIAPLTDDQWRQCDP